MIRVFWWHPACSIKSLTVEALHNRRAWQRMLWRGRRSLSNFGDAASPRLIEAITGRRVEWAPITDAHVVAIGSILNSYRSQRSNALVLGSGIRDTTQLIGPDTFDNSRISSVRGHITRNFLQLAPSTP